MRSNQQTAIFIICIILLLAIAACQSGCHINYPDQTEYNGTFPITETIDNTVQDTYPEETACSKSLVASQASSHTSVTITTEYGRFTLAEDETTSRQETDETKETTQKAIEKTSETTVQTTSTTQLTQATTATKSTTTPTAAMPMPTPTPTTALLPIWPERDVPKLRQDMFNATNEVRKAHGVSPLAKGSADLQKIAMIRAEELATQYSHIRPDGTYYDDLLKAYGIEYGITRGCAAENIARFSELGTVESVISAWSGSSGHLDNIIRSEHDTVAIGYYQCQYGRQYWVQIFTGENSW